MYILNIFDYDFIIFDFWNTWNYLDNKVQYNLYLSNFGKNYIQFCFDLYISNLLIKPKHPTSVNIVIPSDYRASLCHPCATMNQIKGYAIIFFRLGHIKYNAYEMFSVTPAKMAEVISALKWTSKIFFQ